MYYKFVPLILSLWFPAALALGDIPSLYVSGNAGYGLAESDDGLMINSEMYQGELGVFWGSEKAGRFGIGLGTGHYEWSPRHDSSDYESMAWKSDSIIGNGYSLSFVYDTLTKFANFSITQGKMRLPSRVAQTKDDGSLDANGDRGRYTFLMMALDLGTHIYSYGVWNVSGAISFGRTTLSGGGACVGYDPDCGDDFAEKDKHTVNSFTLKLGTSLWFEGVFGK